MLMQDLSPVIFGLEGTIINDAERQLFTQARPAGYILFTRNCEAPAQLRALTFALKALHDDYIPLILIDQEGGRVARLQAPHWPHPPAPQCYADMATDSLELACAEAKAGSADIARNLIAHGITVNCTPMCDIRYEFSDNIIGDRAYGCDPQQVIALADAVAQGLVQEGVLPIIKHIPGHGRATCDSHLSLPVVNASRAELEQDFAPFKALSHYPMAMTAHIIYSALDDSRPATLSPIIIDIIRRDIGFTNVLMSDDICMRALTGSMADITRGTLDAGCDLVLHCNGDFAQMQEVMNALQDYPRFAKARLQQIYNYLPQEGYQDVSSL